MSRIVINDLSDPRLGPYRGLNQRNFTRRSGLFIAEGDKVVERLIRSRFGLDSLLAEPAQADRFEPLLLPETPLYVVSRQILESTIGFNFHRGVLACGRRKPGPTIQQMLAEAGNGRSIVVVLPDVQDPTNLGSIIRSAAGFGATGVVLGPDCADPLSRRVLRVSMAASLELPIVETRDVADELQALRHAGYELVATVLDADAEPLETAHKPRRLALLFGSEGHGLAPKLIAQCDRRVTIPMQRGTDSLNVAVAAAVLLYHYTIS